MTARLTCLAPAPAASPVALRGLLPHEIRERFAVSGIDEGEARRIFAAVVNRFEGDLSRVHGLRRSVREAVLREALLDAPAVLERREAADGFVKYLLALRDGRRVEAVRIPLEKPRASVCLSMVGCPLRCAFCATGRFGFARALAADEIVGQFLRVRAESPRPVTSAVFMGMAGGGRHHQPHAPARLRGRHRARYRGPVARALLELSPDRVYGGGEPAGAGGPGPGA